MTIHEAYELAVKKWQYIVENDGETDELYKKYPELEKLFMGCAYCELFYNPLNKCKGCPLSLPEIDDLIGCGRNSVFYKYSMYDTKESAQAVLDLIIKTKPQ